MAWSENRKKAMEELGRGRELANQLRDLLSKSLGDEGLMGSRSSSSCSEDLVTKIFNSFANTLSILRNNNHNNIGDYDEVSVSQQNNNMSCWKSGHLAESIKSTTTTTTISTSTRKDRRRKHVESYVWTRDTPALFDDGYAWRKYGQKVILRANHPRHYYRCTHKSEQGCQATKQVQKIEDDPPMYRTTYHGHHTCKNLLNAASQLILDSSIDDSFTLLSFANNNQLTNKHDSKESMSSDITSCCNRSALPEHLLSPDHHLTMLEPPAQMTVLPADHQTDAISGVLDFVDLDYLLEF